MPIRRDDGRARLVEAGQRTITQTLASEAAWRHAALCADPFIAHAELFTGRPIEAFLVSTGVVALGEMGDKTQRLAMLLAVKFKRPLPIILGILVAVFLGDAIAKRVSMPMVHAVAALIFLVLGLLTLFKLGPPP